MQVDANPRVFPGVTWIISDEVICWNLNYASHGVLFADRGISLSTNARRNVSHMQQTQWNQPCFTDFLFALFTSSRVWNKNISTGWPVIFR